MASANLAVSITGSGRDLINEFHKVGDAADRSSKKTHAGWQKAKQGFQLAGAAIAGGAIAIGVASVKAAIEEQKAQALLAQSLKTTTGANKEQVGQVEKWITATQNASGIMDDELRPALSSLLRVTGSVTKSQSLLKTAMDVSTATGKPLQAVTLALGKAYNGSTGALGKLGIKTKDAAGHALSFKDIMVQLKDKMGGATAAAADTTAGKIAILKARFEDTKEQIGGALIPVLLQLGATLASVVAWLDKHRAVAITLAAVVGTLAAVTVVWAAAVKTISAVTKIWTAGQWLLNAALTANPIGLLVVGIAALIAGVVLAYMKIKPFREAVNAVGRAFVAAGRAIIDGIGAALSWARANWPTILAILTGPIGVAVLVISKNWDTIKSGVTGVVKWVAAAFGIVVGIVTGLPGKISGAAAGMFDGITDAFRGAINSIIDIWNALEFTTPSAKVFGHKIGGVTIGTPDLPHFAQGGIVPGAPGLAQLIVAHGGERVLTQNQDRVRMSSAGASVVNENHFHIKGHVVGSTRELGQLCADALIRYQRANGKRWLAQGNA